MTVLPVFGVMGASVASSMIWGMGAIGCGWYVAKMLPSVVSVPFPRFART